MKVTKIKLCSDQLGMVFEGAPRRRESARRGKWERGTFTVTEINLENHLKFPGTFYTVPSLCPY